MVDNLLLILLFLAAFGFPYGALVFFKRPYPKRAFAILWVSVIAMSLIGRWYLTPKMDEIRGRSIAGESYLEVREPFPDPKINSTSEDLTGHSLAAD